MDHSVDTVEQWHQGREVRRQVKLHQLDDDTIRDGGVRVANRVRAGRGAMELRPGLSQALEHPIEVGGLQAEVGDPKPGTKRTHAWHRRLGRPHAARKLADDQKLPTEEHPMVPAVALGGRDDPEVLAPEARLVEANRRLRVDRVNVNVVDGGNHTNASSLLGRLAIAHLRLCLSKRGSNAIDQPVVWGEDFETPEEAVMLLLSTCMVQEGRLSDDQKAKLEGALKTAIREHVGADAKLAVAWMTIPPGSGYSAGKPSTSSLVQLSVPDGFPQRSRAALMHEVSERWCAVSDQSKFELMVSVPDRTAAQRLLKGMLSEVPLGQKPALLANHVSQLVRSFVASR